jgi:hypothetical protein
MFVKRVFFCKLNCLSTLRFKHRKFISECQWKTNHWDIKGMPASIALLASPLLHKYYSDNVDDNTYDCFLLINKSYWTMYALQTNNNYTFSFEYHNPFPLALVMCSTQKFWNVSLNNIQQFNWAFAWIQHIHWKKKTYLATTTWTHIFDFHINADLLQ